MSEIAPSHPCPICSTPVPHWERYPVAVCQDCHNKACNAQGQKLSFFNESMSGGFGAIVADTKADYPSHICYIEGKKCWADEARFGGIVIQTYTERSPKLKNLLN
jgi:predicted nucleic acid-binding Zn ribbon protein